ncbi:MAG: cobalamin-dependent protein [Ignavibacteriaceae bacterium]|nr:cobalamin-dependent protein [Ignavibacteriaceae bacterium]
MIREVYFFDFFNSLIVGDKTNCSVIIETLHRENVDVKKIYTNLFQRSLFRIGKMWDENQISIAEEHAATQVIESLMGLLQLKYRCGEKTDKKAIISCVDKEFHLIGARMAAHIFELNGWNVSFLGASTPTREIIKLIEKIKPDIVGLSFNFYLNFFRLTKEIDTIRKHFPDLKILIGGQGVKQTDEKVINKYENLFYFNSLFELDTFIKKQK